MLQISSHRHNREHGGGETGESRQQAQLNLGTEYNFNFIPHITQGGILLRGAYYISLDEVA